MTPERKRELKDYADGLIDMHHGGLSPGAAILECLEEIDRLEKYSTDVLGVLREFES